MHQRDKEYTIHSISSSRGVTPIDQLINLDDEEKTRTETLNKIKSRAMIRNTGAGGGMSSYEKYYNSPDSRPPPGNNKQEEIDQYVESENNEGYGQIRARSQDRIYREPYGGGMEGMYGGGYQEDPYRSYNCVDVANHSKNCPVCSKLYNNDKSIYILIIGLLAIICVILFKSKMEK